MIYKKAIDAEQACDVLVVGGGPAGVCAAVSAARQGVKTVLVERFGVLGGMMTAGHVDPILGSVAPGTMYDEVVSLLAKAHPQSVTAGRFRSMRKKPKPFCKIWFTKTAYSSFCKRPSLTF